MTTLNIDVYLEQADLAKALREDVQLGLTSRPKWLPPKWFYDARGSQLFEQITRLPEYYPTRAERAILLERGAEIATITEANTLIELGSGSSDKTRHLLDVLLAAGTLTTFAPLDVSESALRIAVSEVARDYPGLHLRGIVGDFTRHIPLLPQGGSRLVAFLGGTVGNLLPTERAGFLAGLRGVLEPGEWLLLGTDLVKDPGIMIPAYDDAAGVTAAFNRNVLQVLNRQLGADFDLHAFAHEAVWNPRQEWIEMRLRSIPEQRVSIPGAELDVDFGAGEPLRTEVSAKFRQSGVAAELSAASFECLHWWTDPDSLFGVSLSVAR